DKLARPQPGVHQSLDGAQLGEFVGTVLTLGVFVASRVGETVAALPDAQHVFRQAGLTLDRADVEACLRTFHNKAIRPGQRDKVITPVPRTWPACGNCPRQIGMLYFLVFRGAQQWRRVEAPPLLPRRWPLSRL